MVGGMSIRRMAVSMAVVAVLSETPGGRLNDTVLATRRPWWLTTSGVSPCAKRATLDSGIIVSRPVLTAIPVDAAPLPVAPIELVARFRTTFAATELIEVFSEDETTVPATALVACEPLADPPEVLT